MKKASEMAAKTIPPASAALGIGLETMTGVVQKLNIGYVWMLLNCLASAGYVSRAEDYLRGLTFSVLLNRF